LNPIMVRLRAGVIAVILSLSDGGAIEPSSVALGADPARAIDAATLGAAEQQFFERQVRPLLVEHCYQCHSSSAKVLKGGLRLDSRAGWMKGGDSGPAIVPGAPDESLLIEAIRYRSLEMPPRGKLREAEIAALERWVRMGAPDPRTDPAPARPSRADLDAGRSHWAFRPIADPPVPRVKHGTWPRSDVDRFILARLESEGLTPVADVDRPTLLRRVFFDLAGVPPTPAEIEAFLADETPDAFERIVDALLGRPEFGQCWGRHWLDVARYADSNGSDENFTFYDAWRYRNYVIGAFNADKPFDRFLTEQVAGDLLPFSTQEERDDNLMATGFLVVGPKVIGATDKEQLLVDVIDEQLDTIGKAFLGLTIGCARCHDHKFDPISARDYYALAGILASTETIHGNLLNRRDLTGWNLHPLGSGGQAAYEAFLAHEKSLDGRMKEQKDLQSKRDTLKNGVKPAAGEKTGDVNEANVDPGTELRRIEERLAVLKREIANLKENPVPRPPLAMSVNDQAHPGPMAICIRGDAHNRGVTVPRGFLAIVGPRAPDIGPDVSGRAQLAAWLTDARNPLTGRVAVNRVWQHLFGQGLVGTPDDFGTRGEHPSHPELLDHLARRFVRQGWSVKRLIRHLVLSRTYRLSSDFHREAAARDPEDRWLWRMNRRRLRAEALRDGLLAVSGQLDRSPAGSVVAGLNVQATGVGVKPNPPVRSVCRTIYLPVIRNDLPALFQLFDFGDSLSVNGRRSTTNVAPQALFLMNSPLVLEAANDTAASVLAGCEVSDERRVLERLYVRILGRRPHPDEVEPSLALVRAALSEPAGPGPLASGSAVGASARARAWAVLGHALFCSTSFQYLD
jgi:mono/diheme cytochrome c family protein